MLRSDADAPKPPAYPFIPINVKERGHKNSRAANLLAHPAALPPVVLAKFFDPASEPFKPRFRVPSASVRGLLRLAAGTRKRKNARCDDFLSVPRKTGFSLLFRPVFAHEPAPDQT
jgi:hypothetical protein